MDPVLLYASCIGSALCLLILFQIGSDLGRKFKYIYVNYVRNLLVFPLLFTRGAGSSNVTYFDFATLALYLLTNVAFLSVYTSTHDQLSTRSSVIFMINITLLYLGGRTNILLDKVLHIEKTQYDLMHRWVGRVTILEGVLHGVLRLRSSTAMSVPLATALLVVLLTTFFLSLLPFRRRSYELFLATHFALAMSCLVLLWLHLGVRKRLFIVLLGVSCACWTLQRTAWLFMLWRHNWGSGENRVTIQTISEDLGKGIQAVQLLIKVQEGWKSAPGQYVYLTLPSCNRHKFSILQSHPYQIAWVDKPSSTRSQQVALLVETRRGFSNDIRFGGQMERKALLDGPYGVSHNLNHFDKVLFFASGIGVATHLLYIRNLLRAHNENSARVRRISLVWLVEGRAQVSWVQSFLDKLIDEDERCILTMVLYLPYETEETRPTEKRPRVFEAKQPLVIDWTISKESSVEAGSMAVLVCGHPLFERRVRRAVSGAGRCIALLDSSFQPDETQASRACWPRFDNSAVDQRARLRKQATV